MVTLSRFALEEKRKDRATAVVGIESILTGRKQQPTSLLRPSAPDFGTTPGSRVGVRSLYHAVMIEKYPSPRAIQNALLMHIYESGGDNKSVHCASVLEPLADRFNLSEELRRRERSGERNHGTQWRQNIHQARNTLTNGKLILRPSLRNIWQLTEKGAERARELLEKQETVVALVLHPGGRVTWRRE